jgi:poly(hydroxyalkanoate) depolymerase family esterase
MIKAYRHTTRVLGLIALVAGGALASLPLRPAHGAGSFVSKTYGGHTYKVYVPGGYVSGTPVPVVLMLHGCTQDPDQFATGTELNSYAESNTFLAVYPDQPTSIQSNKCWQWYDSAHQSRGSGEPALLAGLVGQVKTDYSVDSNRVYVAGLSAGAAMSVIMGATYPDVFAAIAVGSGLEYKAGTTQSAGTTAMTQGGPDPVTQGNAAYTAMGQYKRSVPAIVFHGSSDYIVYPVNGNQVLSQWAQTDDRASDGLDNNNIDDTADATVNGTVAGGRSYTDYVYKDSTTGATVLEKYIVSGMGHAWSGGNSAGSYTDPQGPKASAIIWQFFVAHPMNGAPAPTATPTGPTATPTRTPIPPTATATGQPTATRTATPVPPTSTATATAAPGLTFASLAAEDGYAGALTADGTSTTVQQAGDKGMYNIDTYRTILSFDTSALPDTATIDSVKLRVYRQALAGSVSGLSVDVINGSFGGSSALAQTDYSAAASAVGIASLGVPAANNSYSEVSLPGSAFTYVSKTGRTQFRLKATTAADFAQDLLTLYGGENSTYAPTLVVTYH